MELHGTHDQIVGIREMDIMIVQLWEIGKVGVLIFVKVVDWLGWLKVR